MEERIDTSTIKDFVNKKPKRKKRKPNSSYSHTKEYIQRKEEREAIRLQEKLTIQVKSEDPAPFLTDDNLIKIVRLPGETYKLIPTTTRYYVSNLGNALKIVYDKKAEKFIEHKLCLVKSVNKTKRIYIDITVQLETGEHVRCRLSRAMAKAFLDPTFPLLFEKGNKLIVDHIDNNSENNILSNLRIFTCAENINAAMYEQGKVVGKPMKICYAYNIDTKELKEYASTSSLVEDMFGKDNNGWFYNYNKNKIVTPSGWTFGYDPEELETRKRRKGGRSKSRKISD